MSKSVLKQFMDAGMHTVPLGGELRRRREGGKKTIPEFERGWMKKYSTQKNDIESLLGGAITGAVSDVVALDCDNELTYKIFTAMDPENEVHFVSKDKPEGGGTILYKYVEDLQSFSSRDSNLALDFLSDKKFMYLPTEHNYTKEEWKHKSVPTIPVMPNSVIALLKALAAKTTTTVIEKRTSTREPNISNRLAPLVEKFTSEIELKYMPSLFKIITPKSYRDLPEYVTQGHIHPNDIPAGHGSKYLSKVSAILGADISISRELYQNAMLRINQLWDDPMDENRLLTTIINPMVEERTMINNMVAWQYDKYWAETGFIVNSMNGDYIESFYDDVKGLYYVINYGAPYIQTYGNKKDLLPRLKSMTGMPLVERQYDAAKQLIRTVIKPTQEFGHIAGTGTFNLFKQTPALQVINNPGLYEKHYQYPEATIQYLEAFIPDELIRTYILSFLRTKFTTFKYSPIVLFFIGTQGSGKDTFVNLLSNIIGDKYIAKPAAKVFLEQYNGWFADKFFVQLDEYGNMLNRPIDKQEALGRIKTYSGSPEVQIRAMRRDGYNYRHSATILMTANTNPLVLETQDRRIAYASTPNRLDRMDWVVAQGGISTLIRKLNTEVLDFCYYLSTQVKNLTDDAYVVAPDTKDKAKLIFDSMPTYKQLANYVETKDFAGLEKLGAEYGVQDFTYGWRLGRITQDSLKELYFQMTEGAGNPNAIKRAMADLGIPKERTSRNGENMIYYTVAGLSSYEVQHFTAESDTGFDEANVDSL